jgi:3'-phosphoadenosine 5'-phosphosulfate sulfotransferase (PAPS reductase)/FAD synthetase
MTSFYLKLFFEQIQLIMEEIKEIYLDSKNNIVIGWSGGKDSTCVLVATRNHKCLRPQSSQIWDQISCNYRVN